MAVVPRESKVWRLCVDVNIWRGRRASRILNGPGLPRSGASSSLERRAVAMAARKATKPRDPGGPGAFFVVQKRRKRDVGDRDAALPRQRRRGEAGAARGARVGGPDAGPDGRPEVLRPARVVAAHDPADHV